MKQILFLGALACCSSIAFAQNASDRPEYKDPPALKSENGVLEAEFVVAPTKITLDGKEVTTLLYNGLFAPPTLHLNPGDQLKLKLTNQRDDDPTNVHYHGTNVSPKKPADSVFIRIDPGESYEYTVDFPKDHPQGLFWYHPHWHGTTEYQIGSGLSGLISVDGVLDPWPELKDIKTRYMILRDIQIDKGKVPNPPDPGNPTMRMINGLVNPSIPIRPGEIQFWRVGNIGADIFYDLEIEGHQIFELARDGIRNNQPTVFEHLLLPTSSRTEFLVVGGQPGEYIFRTREIDMGPAGDPHPETVLGTLVVSGEPVTGMEVPNEFPQLTDLRDAEICCGRTYDFSETSDGNTFCINNVGTDMNIVNTTVRIGCVEEWTINNCTGENHNFHHHQLQFQVVKMNGKEVPFTGWQDTVTVPYRSADKDHPNRCQCDDQGNCYNCTCPTAEDPHGSIVVRIPYLDPVIEGKAVYHCHIGEHEDAGMMQIIEMSKTAGRCEPGEPSTINRLSMSSTDRAKCVPGKKHDHGQLDLWQRVLAAAENGANAISAGNILNVLGGGSQSDFSIGADNRIGSLAQLYDSGDLCIYPGSASAGESQQGRP
ncbi:MAG: multicopper oxidase family protein [Pseudomonadota bacterium]